MGYSVVFLLAIKHLLEYNNRVSLRKGVIAPFRKEADRKKRKEDMQG